MLNKLLLLLVTGMPGLHKLIFFFAIESIYGTKILGIFSNDYYIIQIFIIFSAVGLGALLMIKLPKLNNLEIKEYTGKLIVTFFLICIMILPLIYFLNYFNYIYYIFDSFILLIGMSGNLIMRHYYLSLKKYANVFIYDILIFILIILVFLLKLDYPVLLLVGTTYLVSFFIFMLKLKINLFRAIINFNDIKMFINISLVNFLSAGVYFVLIPIVNKQLGEEYTGLIGIIFVISSILILIPRALSMYFLPELSKNAINNNNLISIYKKFLKINIISLFLLFSFSILLLVVFQNYFLSNLFKLNNSNIMYLLFMFSILISQLSLAPSNILMAIEKTNILKNIGIQLVFIYIIIYFILKILEIKSFIFVYLFMIMMISGNLYRFYVLNNKVKEGRN
jgi:O-antigen/teichoic acid export membrane protein